MHQGCDLRLRQGDCGGGWCCPRCPNLRVEVGGVVDDDTKAYVAYGGSDNGDSGGGGMGRCIPNSMASPNTSLHSNDMGNPKRSKGSPSRSTNCRQVLPLRPTNRTLR